jgi:uncharacterized membrane protein YeaQ/YmgE (transglycosylase-associated protein family)
MAWLAWTLLGFVLGIIFKLVARTHGPGAWFAGICVGVGGGLTGGWIVSLVWGEGVLDVRAGNLIGAVLGAIILLAIYWYRLRHRLPGTEYINPNAM